jgi:hypothetical protein
MARTRGHDSHAGGEMLNYSIRGPLAPSISHKFYDWIGRGGSSSTNNSSSLRSVCSSH